MKCPVCKSELPEWAKEHGPDNCILYMQDTINDLLEACKSSLAWISKVSADQPEGDPTGVGAQAMRQYTKVEQAIHRAENEFDYEDWLDQKETQSEIRNSRMQRKR